MAETVFDFKLVLSLLFSVPSQQHLNCCRFLGTLCFATASGVFMLLSLSSVTYLGKRFAIVTSLHT